MYAGFWKRFFAAIIDGIILSFTLFIAGYVIGYIFYSINDEKLITITNIMVFIASWLYHALLECSSKQATWGKQIIGIKVTNLNGGRVDFGQASGRYFGMFLSVITLGIGFIMVGFTKKKQGLHDIISNCLVVNKNYNIESNNSPKITSHERTVDISEAHWKEAFNELDTNRNIGVWAKVFSENKGNDSAARADYIKIRAEQLQDEIKSSKKNVQKESNAAVKSISENDYISLYIKGKYSTEKIKNDVIYSIGNEFFAFKNHGFVYFFNDKKTMLKSINEFNYFDSSIAMLDNLNKRIK